MSIRPAAFSRWADSGYDGAVLDTRPLRAQAAALLRARVREALCSREALLPPVQEALTTLGPRLAGVEAGAAGLARESAALQRTIQGWREAFSAAMIIDDAWRRHPGAPAVFARHHLPACDGCAVRFDETLEEAALAYGLDLDALLADLNRLLAPSRPPRPASPQSASLTG